MFVIIKLVSVSNGEGSQTSTSTRSAGINSNSSNETKSIVNKESVVNDGHPTNFIKIENKQDGEKTKEKLSAGTVIQDAKVNSDHDHSSPESNYHKEIDIKKEKSSGLKGDFKVGITRPDSSKKIEHVNKGVSDDKTKLKSVKKMDAKPENKLKLVTPEKVKFCDVKVKVEKMAKKDVIVIKSKGNDNKGQKSDEIHKDGTLENKDKKISAEKKPCSSKIPESQVKIKSEEHFKNKPEPHRVDDIPKTKKNESKEKDDLKSHKSLPKSKSFEDRDDGKSKLEKSIIDKGKEDASKKCGSSDSVKNDKNKDERPKSDSGKPSKPAELSKGEHKPKSDKLKSMEKRPESSKHKFSDKSDRSSETKLKLLERSKSSECVMRHEEGKVVLGDKKGINTSGHRKVKEFDKGAQEKHKSSSCEVKPKEAEIISSSKLKSINVFKTTCSSTKEEKGKVKKETDRESTKVKVDEKVQALSSFTKQVSYTDKSDNQEKYSDLKYDDKSHSQLIDEKSIDLEQTLQSKSLMNKHSSQAACKKYDSKDKLGKRKLSETGTESDDFLSTRKQKCEQNTSSSNFYSEDYTKDSSNEKRLGTMGNIPDGQLSDVTVSSVHTSDLSDFDDRISLSESDVDEVENSSSSKILFFFYLLHISSSSI